MHGMIFRVPSIRARRHLGERSRDNLKDPTFVRRMKDPENLLYLGEKRREDPEQRINLIWVKRGGKTPRINLIPGYTVR